MLIRVLNVLFVPLALAAKPFPTVPCGDLTPSSCVMTCEFAQLDIELGLSFPGPKYQMDWACGDLSAKDILTCWACDQTGVDMSKPLDPATTPDTNATFQAELYSWAHVCDQAWIGDENTAADLVGKQQSAYPDGYSCSSGPSGPFIKQGVDISTQTSSTRTLVSGDGSTSEACQASSASQPALSGVSTLPGNANGTPSPSPTLRLGGDGDGQKDGAGMARKTAPTRLVSFCLALLSCVVVFA